MPASRTQGGRPKGQFSEAHLLALLPAFAFFCVQRYEAGRFAYLGVPSEFIDLTLLRLIAGGTALIIFAVLLFTALQWGRNFLAAETGWRRFAGYLLISLIFVGIPQFMQTSTKGGMIWAALLTIALAMSGGSGDSGDASETEESSAREKALEPVALLIFAGVLATLLYSVGFFAERVSANRLCIAGESNSFVAALSGERALVKRVDPETRRLVPGVIVRQMSDGMSLLACRFPVVGELGVMDQAFSAQNASAKNPR